VGHDVLLRKLKIGLSQLRGAAYALFYLIAIVCRKIVQKIKNLFCAAQHGTTGKSGE
jgi:hypothetical protein